MGCQALFIEGSYLDGEEKLSTTAADYVAGMPAKITANGLDLATSPGDVIGLMKNDKSEDDSSSHGEQVGDAPIAGAKRATVLKGTPKVQMTKGTLKSGVVQAPWTLTPTGGAWAVGNKLFVNASGLWDNAGAAGTDPSFGVVSAAPADIDGALEADLSFHHTGS